MICKFRTPVFKQMRAIIPYVKLNAHRNRKHVIKQFWACYLNVEETDRIKNQANSTKSTTKTKGEHSECHSYLHKFDREFPNLTPFELEVEILQCDFCCDVVPNKASYGIHRQSLSQTPHHFSTYKTYMIW